MGRRGFRSCFVLIVLLFMSDFLVGPGDFSSFSRSPDPPDSGPSPVVWTKFTQQEQAYLVIDVQPRLEHRFRAQKVAFWNEVVPKLLELTEVKKENSQDKTQKNEL